MQRLVNKRGPHHDDHDGARVIYIVLIALSNTLIFLANILDTS